MNNFPSKPTPPIQKTVPVKKNGFILELQVAPPGNLHQSSIAPQGHFQPQTQTQGQMPAQTAQQITQNAQFQNPHQASQPAYNQPQQQNIEYTEEKKSGKMPSLRDLFNR